MKAAPVNLRRAVLLPFVVGSVALFLVLLASLHSEEGEHVAHDFVQTRGRVAGVYDRLLAGQAQQLALILETVAAHDRPAQAYLNRDRTRLQAIADEQLNQLRRRFGVVRLTIYTPDRAPVFGAGDGVPPDEAPRSTTLIRAAEAGHPVQGVELGRDGRFELHAVQPWRHNGRLLGYLQLTAPVNGLFEDLRTTFGLLVVPMLEKQRLDRERWEAGGSDRHWDLLPEEVVLEGAAGLTEAVLRDLAGRLTVRPLSAQPLTVGGREYFAVAIPLRDVSRTQVGRVLVMGDFTERVGESYGVIGAMSGASLIIGPFLFGLFYLILQRAERQIAAWRRRVTEESEARMAMQEAHIRALQYAATHDSLTELPNRKRLDEHLGSAVQQARAEGNELALVLLNLQRISEINDTLGHDTGDRVLQQVAERLRNGLPPQVILARPGGDEFGIIFPAIGEAGVMPLVEAIQGTLAPALHIDGISLDVVANIGIARFPEHGTDPVTLLRRADVAMRQAKRDRNHYAVYDSRFDPHSVRRLTLLGDLKQAVQQGTLEMHYQPQVSVVDGRVVGVEALARWFHPELGVITPDEFVPMAEHSGLIKPLTRWALRQALTEQARWRREGIEVRLSVNLSAQDLMDEDLPDYVGHVIADTTGYPQGLLLELTESAAMHDAELALSVMREFASMGLPLAIDDFGTGYSSLAYLKRMPVDELKVDRSFVADMCDDPNDASIVASTIGLAHSLGLTVVAEGVEDRQTWAALAELDCDIIQGYYVSQPMDADRFVAWYHSVDPVPGHGPDRRAAADSTR